MKKIIMCLIVLFFAGRGLACAPNEVNTVRIDRKVGDYDLRIDQRTPLDAFLSFEYILTTGKYSLLPAMRTWQYRHTATPGDIKIREDVRQAQLHSQILEMHIYRDSVAAVVAHNSTYGFYPVTWLRVEEGKWVFCGQTGAFTEENARGEVERNIDRMYGALSVIRELQQIPQNTAPFIEHVKNYGKDPKEFVIEALQQHPLVIYGELHRRKLSWYLLKEILADNRFMHAVGTVFMELPSHRQADMDRVMAGKTFDSELVIDILCDEQLQGWYDKGEYEFIREFWKYTRRLHPARKIRMVLVDYQVPYSAIDSKEDYQNYPVMMRDQHMADLIEHEIRTSADTRNRLFIVGYSHARKSAAPAGRFTGPNEENLPTVAGQLAQRFGNEKIYSIFQHVPILENNGSVHEKIRFGIFDQVFEQTGNHPLAFSLAGSPFGAEPYDADPSTTYDSRTGTFQDNFDGYLFLAPLDKETSEGLFPDMVTDRLVNELKRRAAYAGVKPSDRWYGIPLEEMTAEKMQEELRRRDPMPLRWESLFIEK